MFQSAPQRSYPCVLGWEYLSMPKGEALSKDDSRDAKYRERMSFLIIFWYVSWVRPIKYEGAPVFLYLICFSFFTPSFEFETLL